MSSFGGLIFTNVGRNLQAKAQAGAALNFTRIAIGDGALGGSSISDLTALKNQTKTMSITKLKTMTGGKAVVGTSFSNSDITSGFYWRELGVFASDPDLGEILYCYGNAGNNAEYIPAGGGADIVEKAVDCVTIVGNASSVSAVIDQSLVFASQADLNFETTARQNADTALNNLIIAKEDLIKNATTKTSMADADTIPLTDSADSSKTKKISFANLKAVLKTYFDTLYNKVIIANTLTETTTGKALDATQGKALNDIISTKATKFVGITAGTATALTATITDATLADYTNIQVRLHTDIGAGATLNLNALGAKPIYTSGNVAVSLGALTGSMLNLMYNATLERWYLLDILSMSPYTTNMVKFFAIPGISGKVRLKVEKPTTSDGVIIRYKTTAWSSGDTKDTGTLVANITDDTNYKGINQWYEVSGLTDGTAYYFKAFPYRISAYNETVGSNETVCKSGGLVAEYTMDSVAGSTINDTCGNAHNATLSNITFGSGKVGNKAVFNGSSAYANITYALSLAEVGEVSFYMSDGTDFSTAQRIFAIGTSEWGFISQYSNKLIFGYVNTGGSYCAASSCPNTTTGKFFNCVFSKNQSSNTHKAYINNVLQTMTQESGSGVAQTISGASNIGKQAEVSSQFLKHNLDQFRVFSRELETYERANLYNGGAGC